VFTVRLQEDLLPPVAVSLMRDFGCGIVVDETKSLLTIMAPDED
jgi:hypothetical protein